MEQLLDYLYPQKFTNKQKYMTNKKIVDRAGKELNIGDLVISATKCTSSAYLRVGVIWNIFEITTSRSWSNIPIVISNVHVRNIILGGSTPTISGVITKHAHQHSIYGEVKDLDFITCTRYLKFHGTLKDFYNGEALKSLIGTKYEKFI